MRNIIINELLTYFYVQNIVSPTLIHLVRRVDNSWSQVEIFNEISWCKVHICNEIAWSILKYLETPEISKVTSIHFESIEFIWSHINSLEISRNTWSNLKSHEFALRHLKTLTITWINFNSQKFSWSHFSSLKSPEVI